MQYDDNIQSKNKGTDFINRFIELLYIINIITIQFN